MSKSYYTNYNKDQQEDDIEDLDTIPVRRERGLSKTSDNIKLVGRARDFMFSGNGDEEFFAEKTEFTFNLPDLTKYPENFKAFLFKELVESSMLVSLEQEGHLNWWTDVGICERLLPMVTSGDGNCLLHAASLSMWGFHDRVLALRRSLNTVMTKSRHLKAFRRRWRHQQTSFLRACGLVLNEDEWMKEWDLLVKVTSLEPRNSPWMNSDNIVRGKLLGGGSVGTISSHHLSTVTSGAIYESLDEFHVFVLSHIVRRPIIVIANPFLKNSKGENFSPVPFRGVYLPLERAPEDCSSSPLLLAYNLGHFCALVPMAINNSTSNMSLAIPLVDSENNLLPIHFLVDPIVYPTQQFHEPTSDEKVAMLRKYLDIEIVSTGDFVDTIGKEELLIDLSEGSSSNAAFNACQGVNRSIQGTPRASTVGYPGNMNNDNSEYPPGFDQSRCRRSSLQSTKFFRPVSGSYMPASSQGKVVICARLNVKKTPFASELVDNYLKEAKLRFEGMSEQRGRQLEEIRTRSKDGVQLRHVDKPQPPSGKSLGFSIFKTNNVENKTKPSHSDTFPPKVSNFQGENKDFVKNLTMGMNRGAIDNNIIDYRNSAPVGVFDRRVEYPVALGVVVPNYDKKELSGPVKTIQRLLGQNKGKSDKSTFYQTSDLVRRDTMVAHGKSKFYATIDELDGGSTSGYDGYSNPPSNLSKPTTGAIELPGINQRNFPTLSSSPFLQPHDVIAAGNNFSTFPTRSSAASHRRTQVDTSANETNTASLPKIKIKDAFKGKVIEQTLNVSNSTSDPNIFETNRADCTFAKLNINISNSNNNLSSTGVARSNPNQPFLVPGSNFKQQESRPSTDTTTFQVSGVVPCKTDMCMFFGSKEKDGYCSVCSAERGEEDKQTGSESSKFNISKGYGDRGGSGGNGSGYSSRNQYGGASYLGGRGQSRGPGVTEYQIDEYGYPFCQTKL